MKEPAKSTACSNFEPVHPQFFAKKCKTCGEDISAHGASTTTEEVTSPQPKSRRGSKIQAWEKHADTPVEEPKEKPVVQTGKLKMLDMWKDKLDSTSPPEDGAQPAKKEEEKDSGLKALRTGGGGAGNLKAQWEAQATGGSSSTETEKSKPSGGGTGKFVVNTPLCSMCQKACYPQEAITYDKQLYHKSCFKCLNCKNEVSISAVAMIQGKLYCKTCFQRLFKTRGKYDDL